MDSKHAIFHRPYEVTLKFEDAPIPSNYAGYPETKALGKTVPVWRVQTVAPGRELDFGVVSDPYGFEDSPDAELISSGLNSKGPRSVAIGRHGNFFLWGFTGAPSQMTPEARRVFVNSLVYIHRFDRKPPLVRRVSRSRDWINPYLGFAERSNSASGYRQWFPERLVTEFGADAAKYRAFYTAQLNAVLFSPEAKGFDVDPEVLAAGGSNRSVDMLERCVVMLERRESADLALRLLRRYTDVNFLDAAGWRKWLDQNKSRLFFSDVGGYKFFVNPDAPARSTGAPSSAPVQGATR